MRTAGPSASAVFLSSAAIWAGAPLLICRHVSAAQSLWLGSLTAQCGSSINQRHFQCPITETVVLGLSEADSSPIHLPARQKKKSHCGTPLQEDPLKLFSLGQANNKTGKLLVSGNRQGGSGCWWPASQRLNETMVDVFVKKLISMRLQVGVTS